MFLALAISSILDPNIKEGDSNLGELKKMGDEGGNEKNTRDDDGFNRLIDTNRFFSEKEEISDDDTDRDKNNQQICGPNAIRVNDVCICPTDYPDGIPLSKKGCFKCSYNCSKWASCIHPGICDCKYDYSGNGTFCIARKMSVKMVQDLPDKKINVTIVYESDSHLQRGFCKFNDYVVEADRVAGQYIICSLPKRAINNVFLYVSIDGVVWSREKLIYTYYEGMQILHSKMGWILLGSILSGLMLFIITLLKYSKSQNTNGGAPFVRFNIN